VCNSILKPFDLDTFVGIIGECLKGAHPASESSTRSAG
jgi:hypothetical protein